MSLSYSAILIFLLFNIPIFIFFENISRMINIYDSSDNEIKFQKTPVSLTGGFLIFYNLVIFIISSYGLNINFFDEIFLYSNREKLSFILGVIFFFFLGVYDDKFNLSANKKLLLSFFCIYSIIALNSNLLITELKFSFTDHVIELKTFSFFFTIISFLLFLNALNMFDGINLQVGFYAIIIFIIFILKNIFLDFSFILILSLLIYLYYNYHDKMYLGDSGVYILAFIISYFFVYSYNINNNFFSDEILIIMLVPGLDMFRLFLTRIAKGQNPFKGDNDHLHHLLSRKINKNISVLIIIFFILISLASFYFLNNNIFLILFIIFFYSLLIYYLKKN